MTPQEIAQKWATRTAGATQEYRKGVESVREAPGAKAAMAVDRMIAELVRQRDSGELQRAMESVSLEEWKRSTLDKGADRLASGARAAQGKMQKFMDEFLPFADGVAKSLPPRGDFEQNIQRMVENARKLKEFKRNR